MNIVIKSSLSSSSYLLSLHILINGLFVYHTGLHNTHPPPSIIVPDKPPTTLPNGVTCGSVTTATKSPGIIRSAGFPAHRNNQECAYVVEVPEGYGIQFRFTNLQLETRLAELGPFVITHHMYIIEGMLIEHTKGSLGARPTLQHWMYISHHQYTQAGLVHSSM